jgi:hypothetical protein
MNYRPGVGTIMPATAGTPVSCRLQKATHPRQPPPLDIQKRTQTDLLNRINKSFLRPCQAENQAPALPLSSIYAFLGRLRSRCPLEFLLPLLDTTSR